MSRIPAWRRYLRFFGPDPRADIHDELSFHIESRTKELVERGWPIQEARSEARRQFGDMERISQACEAFANQKEKRVKTTEYLSVLYHDFRYGVVQWKRNLGTTSLAFAALGIGMGVATAVFSIVYAVVLRPLPFPQADRLVNIWSVRGGVDDVVTPRNFDFWRREAHCFSAMAAMQSTTFTLSRSGAATQIAGGYVSSDYFRVFGIAPEMGRTFSPEEDRPPREHLIILSHRLWREKFGASRNIVGAQIRLNREAFTVIGVMPASFSLRPGSEEAWAPLAISGQELNWTGGVLNVIAKLRPGYSRKEAQAEMNAMADRLQKLYPEMNHNLGIRVGDYTSDLTGDFKNTLYALLGAVGLVLLIACANAANLFLARGAGRSQELAIRAALGATRSRIIRQLLAESLLVCLSGALAGLGIAQLFIQVVPQLGLSSIPRLNSVGIHGPVFLFAFLLALFSTLVAGLAPALRASQVNVQNALRQGDRSVAGLLRDHTRGLYISGEVALALVLLAATGSLIRTAIHSARIEPGFNPTDLASGRTTLPENIYSTADQTISAYDRILEKLQSEPGVRSAALTSKAPLTSSSVGLLIKQRAVRSPLKQDVSAELHYVSAGYLSMMQIPLLSGREFDSHDRTNSTQVVLVNSVLAHHLWPAGHAVGQIIRIPELEGRNDIWQVAGVVSDVRVNGVMKKSPAIIYVPYMQVTTHPWRWVKQSMYLVVRTRGKAADISDLFAKAIGAVDPELPLGDLKTMRQRLEKSAMIMQLYTLVLTVLGCCGLILTLAGIYGVAAYYVRRQRAEIGIRLALGASHTAILMRVLRQGMRPAFVGIAPGVILAFVIMRLLVAKLFGAIVLDPLTLAAVTVILIATATLACYIPAREALKIDPASALRNK